MGSTQVNKFHPVLVGASFGTPQVVKNLSGSTVYYKADPSVSSSTKDGELTENQEVTITNNTWFITKTEEDTELRVFAADPSAVEGASIDTADIEAKAVTAGKVTEATVPLPVGGESLTAVAGVAGVVRAQNFAYTAKKEASAKVKLIHTLGTTVVIVTAFTTTAKIPTGVLDFGSASAGAIASVEVKSATEVVVTLAAAEPAAKEEFIYSVSG